MNHISIDFIIKRCKKIFEEKLKDYDFSWRVVKICSMIDQIFIKVFRIHNIQKRGSQKVEEEKIIDTYMDVINYIVITLIKLNINNEENISHPKVINLYNQQFNKINSNKKIVKREKLTINKILEYILYLKQKKEEISLEQFLLKLLNMTLILLKDDMERNK
ncbi:MAG: DUF1599 domain-containing protein [Flavobacteriales bacterium]|jgi:hypothetical protein|uniref:DUF1599 domain-containing protein n=1 Tax=Blattabacterium sp. (Mastotermes darwiniensis) TaxID=39768 RepID=UPI000231DEE8|nr:DUF1599 domain-containing protein [Blattabacterium sp. (Mastotermes darwiniensis)]AER40796.1 hypothetical protein MADAR_509 [Blattabacterium sp. (Mastotermes darwiniensis) str. MADAR]MDR1804641.1 DUF1599 domain-containing protein [Flavobacteriales bacterium]